MTSPTSSLLSQHRILGLLLHTQTHVNFFLEMQVAARELRAAAQGGNSKLVAQQTTEWAQKTIQVDAQELQQICSTPLLYLRAATDKLTALSAI